MNSELGVGFGEWATCTEYRYPEERMNQRGSMLITGDALCKKKHMCSSCRTSKAFSLSGTARKKQFMMLA